MVILHVVFGAAFGLVIWCGIVAEAGVWKMVYMEELSEWEWFGCDGKQFVCVV